MQKETTHMRVNKDTAKRFKAIAYKHGMSMIEFMDELVKKFEEDKVRIEL